MLSWAELIAEEGRVELLAELGLGMVEMVAVEGGVESLAELGGSRVKMVAAEEWRVAELGGDRVEELFAEVGQVELFAELGGEEWILVYYYCPLAGHQNHHLQSQTLHHFLASSAHQNLQSLLPVPFHSAPLQLSSV